MADPIKGPGNLDPNRVPERSAVDPATGPVIRNGRLYPWAWIVGIIILVLIIWGIFGMNHRTRVVAPAMQPAAATSVMH